MADVNINESPIIEARSLVSDIEGELDVINIIHDMMVEQLCNHILSDVDSSKRVNERLFVLLRSLENKLDDVRTLRDKVALTMAVQLK